MKGPRWRGWLVAAAILLLGFAAGAASAVFVGVRMLRHAMQNPASATGPADRAAQRIGAELTRDLKLTPNESARVQTLLDQSAANLKSLRVEAAKRAAAELRASTQRIAAELPEEKRVEFYRLSAKRYERLGLPTPTRADDK